VSVRDLGRHQIRALGLEEPDRLVVEERAVLDRIDACLQCGARALDRVAVRRDLAAERMRGVDDRAHFLRRHRPAKTAADVGQHPAGRRELDHARAQRDLCTHRTTAIVGAVAQVDLLRMHHVGEFLRQTVAAVAVPAGDRDHFAGVRDRGALDRAGVDRVAQRPDAARVAAEIAYGGEPRRKRGAGVGDRGHLVVEPVAVERLEPRAHRVATDPPEMHVHVDHPGQDERVAQVDQRGARLGSNEPVAQLRDLAVADHDRGIPARRLARAIEYRACLDVARSRRRREWWRLRQRRCRDRRRQSEQQCLDHVHPPVRAIPRDRRRDQEPLIARSTMFA
jgi:hypothetical protein